MAWMVVRTGTRRLRRVRHLLCAFALAVAAITPAGSAFATDTSTAVQELRSSGDFRVRVNAALFLGRAKPASARESLEHALSSDPHPAVRTAAAEALGALGDPASIGALEQRLPVEGSSSVKAQLRATIAQLRTGATSPQGDDDGVAGHLRADVRCVVSLGSMRNASGVRGDELRHLLANATRSRARVLHGVVVAGADPSIARQAAARHVPVVTLDGSLTEFSEARVEGSLQVHARVEFTMRRDQSLRGTLSGGATTFGSGPSISDEAIRRLEEDAIDGAVQSALRGAEDGLVVAAR
jgi:hypothetical protein